MGAVMKSLTLDDQTKVPFRWLIGVVVGTVAGGAFWLSTMYSDLAQAKREIAEQKVDQKDIKKTLERIDRGLLKVQVKMGIRPDRDEERF
jgi:hypothetical protein